MKRALAVLLLGGAALANPSTINGVTIKYPSTSLPVKYKIYDHSTTGGISGVTDFANVVRPRTSAAFAAWTAPTVSCTAWTSSYDGLVTSGSGPTRALVDSNDNQNVVVWLSGNQWIHGSGTLGLTTTTYYTTGSPGQLISSDMEMNNTPIQFTSGPAPRWSNLADPNRFDFESVILHEAGHFLGLDHTPASQIAVMYPTVGLGELKRSLAQPDITDVCGVYPGTPGAQGSPCTTTCNAGLVCRSRQSETNRTCTVDCSAGQACPSGLSCQAANTGMACFAPIGSPDLCKFCTSGSDCSSGKCVTDGAGHNYCTVACTGSSCGTGYSCQATTSLGAICVPSGTCTNQCTTPAQCAAGYTCTGGTCEPTGNVGDRCDISFFCKPCSVCIGTAASAYCRSCCGGESGSGECMGCTPASCGAGVCTGLSGGSTDRVCVPAGLAPVCGSPASCTSAANCASGQDCVAGRCHNTCNPASPGTCPTGCYDRGGGSGVCACSDELAQEGETCGLSSTLRACAGTLKCASGICRKTCTLGDNSSCNPGEVCQLVGSAPVCMSGGPGQVCGTCINGTQCSAGLTCVGGRCYSPCNINSATRCATCVQQAANGDGVCACPDQRAQEHQACPSTPPTACVAGLLCLSGFCRGECNIAAQNCLPGLECQFYAPAGRPYCADPGSLGTGGGAGGTGGTSGGSGGAGGTGGTAGAGGAGGGGTNLGCGCGAGGGAPALAFLGLALLGLGRRRRSR